MAMEQVVKTTHNVYDEDENQIEIKISPELCNLQRSHNYENI